MVPIANLTIFLLMILCLAKAGFLAMLVIKSKYSLGVNVDRR